MGLTRRSMLQAGVGGATVGVAGCLESPFEATEGIGNGYAAFFPLWDWAEQVSGDNVEFKVPIESGEMGHGWSPDGNVTRNIASTGMFVYLDTPEFSWTQDIARELEREHDDVAVVDLLDDIQGELLEGGDHEDEHTEDHDKEDNHDEHEDEHDDGFFDPHVWVDPVLAGEMVGSIADALSAADPDNESAYRDNATDYRERLDSVHRQFEELTENADRTVAVLAGHDSFGYLEARYGIELRTPVGTSPNAAESFEDISGLIDVIETHEIGTVLYDPFEAPNPGESYPQMVDLIFEHSDVENAEPLSPAEGTTAAWDENGWGWVEQMEEMNLPALREALGTE